MKEQICCVKTGGKLNRFLQLFVSDKVLINMKKLYPKWDVQKRVNIYYKTKIKNSVYVIVTGIFICVVIAINTNNKSIIKDGVITRNNYMEGEKNVTLKYRTEGIRKEGEINFNVSEKKYSNKEINEIYIKFEPILLDKILGDNNSLDCVTKDLCFVNSISGFPFKITYKVDRPMVVSKDGAIDQDNLKSDSDYNFVDGLDVGITVNIAYEDFRQELVFYVCIFERKLSKEEEFDKALIAALTQKDSDTSEKDFYYLPDSVNGYSIEFFEGRDRTVFYVLLMTFLITFLLYYLKDQQLEDEAKKKREELELDYPAMINKFTLFYNAGMPVKIIWMKLCEDYLREKESSKKAKYLYEEMLLTKKQMNDGMRELEAYEEFAKRINIPEYRTFINLIVQAVQLGKKDLIISMKRECEEAFLKRKNNARRLLEEAGTKLLIPMFMMLSVIFIIILFPAFYSFKL